MPKYYGCPCEGCGEPLTLQDDIVVCPDCGAPYHRTCYEKLGQCIHRPAHAAGYEWKFPYEESQLRTCPACGERTLRDAEKCRCCGAVLPPEEQEPSPVSDTTEDSFDYSRMYRQFGGAADPEKEFFEEAFGKEARMDGIARQDWLGRSISSTARRGSRPSASLPPKCCWRPPPSSRCSSFRAAASPRPSAPRP